MATRPSSILSRFDLRRTPFESDGCAIDPIEATAAKSVRSGQQRRGRPGRSGVVARSAVQFVAESAVQVAAESAVQLDIESAVQVAAESTAQLDAESLARLGVPTRRLAVMAGGYDLRRARSLMGTGRTATGGEYRTIVPGSPRTAVEQPPVDPESIYLIHSDNKWRTD